MTSASQAASLLGLALLLGGAAAAHLEVLAPEPGFRVSLLGAALSAPALVAALWVHGPASLASAAALPGLLALGGLVAAALPHPVIRDVSTAPEDPPTCAQPGVSEDLAGPHDAVVKKLLTAEKRHQDLVGLAPLRLEGGDPAACLPALTEVLRGRGWEVREVPAPEGERLLHAVATSSLFRFRDDVLLRIRGEGEGSCRLDLRSASRVGKSDLGANAARVKDLRGQLAGLPLSAS